MNKQILEKVYKHYDKEVTACLFESETLKRHIDIVKHNLYGDKILEVGSGIGTFSRMLADLKADFTIIDGSPSCIEHTKNNLIKAKIDIEKIKFIETMWEDFETSEKYSDIIFLRGAEHIKDPEHTINHLKKFLVPNGRLHIAVPNGRSMHRKVGVYMNMISRPESFTDGDYSVGHHHVFDFWSFRDLLINKCSMDLFDFKGVMFKFLSNKQMTALFKENPDLPMALHLAGQEMPHLCAEIYICSTNRS